MLKAVKNSKGYVALESVIVTGVVLTLGVYALTQLFASGKIIADSAIDQVNEVMNITTSTTVTP